VNVWNLTAMPQDHRSIREGAKVGLIVATSIWIWLASVDALVGQPFHTFTVLGGVLPFTLMHYVLNVAYGIAVVSGIHAGAREPGFLFAVVLGFLVIEFAFVLFTVLLTHLGLGELAWVRIVGGNVIGAAVGWSILLRTHPVREELREAEEEDLP
jgi:small neutral amino acid transporter SnatA (MarC family)